MYEYKTALLSPAFAEKIIFLSKSKATQVEPVKHIIVIPDLLTSTRRHISTLVDLDGPNENFDEECLEFFSITPRTSHDSCILYLFQAFFLHNMVDFL